MPTSTLLRTALAFVPSSRGSKACPAARPASPPRRGTCHRPLRGLAATALLALGASLAQAAPFAYVTNAFAPSVTVIDTATGQVTATVAFPAGSAPYAVAIAPDLKHVYVTSMDTTGTCGPHNAVYVIDAATNALGATAVPVGCEPTDIAISPDGKTAYVANQLDSSVSVIDTATAAATATISLPRGAAPANIATSADGTRVYLTALGSNGVFVIDTTSNTVLGAPISVGMSPVGIAVSPDGSRLYVTNDDLVGSVMVIDTATNAVVTTLAGFQYPSTVAFTPDGTRAYVNNGAGISVIDTASSSVVAGIAAGAGSIAVTADGKQLYASVEGGNTVSEIDIASNTVTRTLGGMNSPRGVAARPLPVSTTVPNAVGATQAAAMNAIAAAGLFVRTVTLQASSTVLPGIVISQNPPAGAAVGMGAAVDLVVSSGVAVPNVIGDTESAAVSALTAAGLVEGTVSQQASATVPSGSVISQSPAAGTNVPGGASVSLVVSSGSGNSGGGGGGALDIWSLGVLAGLGLMRRRAVRSAE